MASETQPPIPAQVAAPPQSHDAAQREFQLTLSGFSAIDKPEYEDYSRCVHCGLCANNCPTYRLWGREADSPRGRIRQMALVDQGRLELGDAFVTHIDRCLNCRNCETVCPSGVEYGKILELARAQIEQKYKRPLASRIARDFVYRRLLPYPGRIAAAAARAKNLPALRTRSPGPRHRNPALARPARSREAPAAHRLRFFLQRAGQDVSRERPAPRPRSIFRRMHRASHFQRTESRHHPRAASQRLRSGRPRRANLLRRARCTRRSARCSPRTCAHKFRRVSLGRFRRHHHQRSRLRLNSEGIRAPLQRGQHLALARRKILRQKMRDISEFLADLGVTAPLRPLPVRVTYQDSCHLVHGQKIREAPRQLLRAIPALDFVEMALADQCCGSAGVYNVTETETALELLTAKWIQRATNQSRKSSPPPIPAASCNCAPAPPCAAPARKSCT